ncbi:MAG: hypothetical protein PHN57_02650 [Candidatus Omnitrophica bacterium]|nr:hypothetical protein [Candidatus Omnitrophota bacterium]
MPEKQQNNSLVNILSWAANQAEMRKRVFITIGALVLLRLVFLLPLPGLDLEALKKFLGMISNDQAGRVIMLVFGGSLDRFTIFGLGLMPFFSSCILIQLASVAIPKLRRLSFGGEGGRREISKYTYIITIVLSLLQSYFIGLWIENPARFEGMRLVAMAPGLGFRLTCMATMTAAVMLLLFFADLITRHGIGNGIALIAVSFIPLKLFAAARQLLNLGQNGELPFSPVVFAVVFAGFIYVIYFITNRSKQIEFQDEKSNKISLNLRPTITGYAPISFAQSVILFPAVLASLTGARNMYNLLMRGNLLYFLAYFILIAVFTYLYAAIIFSPKYILNTAAKYGYKLVKNNGRSEEEYLDLGMLKVLIMSALFLIGIACIPDITAVFFRIPYLVAGFLGGTAIALAVGVFSDIIRQLEFFRDKDISGIKNWKICYTAFDEIEAGLKSAFLNNKGVPALVEPLRFSWGMPERTMVDQYRIYVPEERKGEAGE